MKNEYAAHISEEKDIHLLEEHLEKTAQRAAQFAAVFGSSNWAYLAGLWHDLGKYSGSFQKMIYDANDIEAHIEVEGVQRRDHSTAGALYAIQKSEVFGRVLAYLISGHHAGLPDWNKVEASGGALGQRIQDKELLNFALKATIPENILKANVPDKGFVGRSEGFALWIRMLFSCLVDADFLDTESFYDAEKTHTRGNYPSLEKLKVLFDAHMDQLQKKASLIPVNRLRTQILAECREAALSPSGLFSLTVPTGGGKTLSSMAFALNHAQTHQKQRIIYVIPYTSIIEQTATIFREIFGESVIEHHSSLDLEKETPQSRLASENWDAPLIVTTNVQFFESLFAARGSRCRKLHNIANSVVILDEAQLMPPQFLESILKTMTLLKEHYGVTFVISTATQPALKPMRDPFGGVKLQGLENVQEIMRNPEELYQNLERVQIRLPKDFQESQTWSEIAEELLQYDSVLVIVNTRADAKELFRLMPEGTIHLSALMCGKHRSKIISEIKRRLKDNIPTRVVSTQLVEAGVDIDFPVVYRAMAGLDSIAQAAGRCNREGKLPEKGKVVLFVPPKKPPAGTLLQAAQKTISLLSSNPEDPLNRKNFTRFFELFYDASDLDKEKLEELLEVNPDLTGVQFRTAAMKMKLIKNAGVSILVRYDDESEILLDRLKYKGPYRELMRELQRYTVNIHSFYFDSMKDCGDLEEIHSGIYALTCSTLYHDQLGVMLKDVKISPEDSVV